MRRYKSYSTRCKQCWEEGDLRPRLCSDEIDIDDGSGYTGNEENVYASEECDLLNGEFLLELEERLEVTTAVTGFVAEKLNYFLEIDRKTLRHFSII